MLHEVDEGGLRPLQVVDDDDLRTLGGTCLEQTAERDARLLGRRGDDVVRVDPERSKHLDERPVGDPVAVGEAATAQDVRGVADALEEVGDEARLADAGRAEEGEEPAGAVGDRVFVVAPEPLALALATDERRLQVPRERRGAAITSRRRNASTGSDLPFSDERLDGLDADGVADEAPASRRR